MGWDRLSLNILQALNQAFSRGADYSGDCDEMIAAALIKFHGGFSNNTIAELLPAIVYWKVSMQEKKPTRH